MSLNINKLDIYLGKSIKNFRIKMRWPLKTLAMKLGVSAQQMHRYETAMNKIPASLLYIIAQEFNTEISFFYEGYEKPFKSLSSSAISNTILLIEENKEDEALCRQAFIEFPKKLNVFSCYDGVEAINYFRKLEEKIGSHFPMPDLIFLDLILPIMNGFDVLKDIKRRTFLQHIPVIVFTRKSSHEDMLKAYCLHASGFINMSFSYREVKKQIHTTLAYWIKTVILPTRAS